ncbi:hypothetical protein [Bacteroides ilei]|uniref:hypothetical protein n=1 Tax=Bacteroides ilei TaxID=1907658 RepID=UPI00092FF35A|nr:hypothetical protein [Bacteroides ilei]
MIISDYYSSLEIKQKSEFIKKVIEICGFSYPTFMTKMRKGSWSKLEREAIEKIIHKELSHADTD